MIQSKYAGGCLSKATLQNENVRAFASDFHPEETTQTINLILSVLLGLELTSIIDKSSRLPTGLSFLYVGLDLLPSMVWHVTNVTFKRVAALLKVTI